MTTKSRQPSRVAVLDICGTLAPEDSWLALTRDMGTSVDRHLEIFHDYREGRITYPESQDQLIGLWRATGKASRSAMRAIFESWPLDSAALPLVEALRAHGYCPLIITGAVDLYAEVVAAKLGIADWYANTPLVFDEAENLVTYHYDLDQPGKKVRQLGEFCSKHGFDAKQAIAFGDGPNDIGLFEATGHGIWLETPKYDSQLRPLAWRTIEHLVDGIALLDQS